MARQGHTWRMTVTGDGHVPLGGAGPLLIERDAGPHPSSVLAESGLRLHRLLIRHPEPSRVGALLARIRLSDEPRVAVEAGDACVLAAEIATPRGLRVLGGIRP
jgi:hypothetical protein